MRIVITGISGTKINETVVPRLQQALATQLKCSPNRIPSIDLERSLRGGKTKGQYLEFLHSLPEVSAITSWSRGALKEFEAWNRNPTEHAILCFHATWQVRGHIFSPLNWHLNKERHEKRKEPDLDRFRPLDRILSQFKPDYFLNVIDNCYVTQRRVMGSCDFRLLETLRWRNIEALQTDLLAHTYVPKGKRQSVRETDLQAPAYPYHRSPCLATRQPADMVARLLADDETPRIYLAYPISEPRKQLRDGKGDEAMREINDFRETMSRAFIAFDPVTIDERPLIHAYKNRKKGKKTVTLSREDDLWPFSQRAVEKMLGNGTFQEKYRIPLHEVREVAAEKFGEVRTLSHGGEIDSQIMYRDYRLIDQSDGVIIYRPTQSKERWGRGGTHSEYEYAKRNGKPVVIIRDRKDGLLSEPPFALLYDDESIVVGRNLSKSKKARKVAFEQAQAIFRERHEAHLKAREIPPLR